MSTSRTSRPALIGRIALAPVLAVAVLPWLAAPASAAAFTVNSTADAPDAAPGNGVCATAIGSCTLRAAIQEANALAGADTITLPAGELAITIPGLNQNDITTGDLDITGDLTITGAGQAATIIDGGPPPPGSPPDRVGLDRIFEVAPGVSSVTLSGVTLRDGWAPEYGGALFNGGNANIGLTNVTVSNGFAGKNGGGLGNHGTGTVTITGSTFTGNDSVEGGSAINNHLGGTVNITNSTITSNTGGAAILNNGELSTQGSLSVTDSTISNNNGGVAGVSRPGGGINNERGSLTVLRTTFTSNNATGDGGGINNSTGTVSVTDSTFTTNSATNGGALATDATGGSVTVAGSTFDGNTASAEGGAVNINGGTLTVTNSTIRNNTATTDGGGLSNNNSGNVTLTTGTVTNNTGASGGGLATHDGSTTTITGSTFTGNHATASGSGQAGDGGAILNNGGPFILRDSTLTGNDAFDGGGLANLSNAASELTNVMVTTNTARQDGGGLSLHSGFITATNVTVTGNTAARDGGGISSMADAAAETTTISRSLIADNVATVHGGGIDSRGDGPLTIDETTIRTNQAPNGGGVTHAGDAPITIKRSTLNANQATNGGGLFLDANSDSTLENTTVSGNTATGFGGGALTGSRLFLVHATVTNNSAPAGAGAGVNNGGAGVGSGFVFPRNSIIALNPTGGNCVGTITSQGANLENTNTCQLTAEGDQVNVTDPKIGPLAPNGGTTDTHALLTLSPALNNANVAPIPATDQRSVPRPQGFQADIGSVESTTPGCTGTVRVISTADSWANQGDPNKNNGADAILKVTSKSPANNTRALMRFDLPALGAGCQVASATLEAYAASATTGRTIQALQVAAPWTESAVTWNNQPATTGPAATTASGLGTRTWNVTTQVQTMYSGANHGFLLRDAAEGSPASPEQQYHAREKAPDRPPRLIITFG